MTKVDVHFRGSPVSVEIGRLTVVDLPPRVFRVRIKGMLFDTAKVFLLPKSMHGIRGLVRYYERDPGLAVLVTGHTDSVGDGEYNERLSDERAAAVAAYLVDDVEAWLKHYSGSPASNPWGPTEDQHMLSALPDHNAPYYAGPITGHTDTATSSAVRHFQADHGLTVDGVAGPATRRALITDYMALDGTTLPAGATLVTHGCGEHHLEIETDDGVDEPANRRVEVFLFEGPVDPAPRPRCNACPEYDAWVRRTIQTIDFVDEPGWLDVLVADEQGSPIVDAEVLAEGGIAEQRGTNVDGFVRFLDIPPGPYRVSVGKASFQNAVFDIDVVSGDAPQAPAAEPLPPSSDVQTRSSLVADRDGGAPRGGGGPSQGAPTGPNTGAVRLVSRVTQLLLVEFPDASAPPELTDPAREGVLRRGGMPRGTVQPRPDIPPWNDVFVLVESSAGTRQFAVDSGPDDPRDGETTITGMQDGAVIVTAMGVHAEPVRFDVFSEQPLGSIDGEQEAHLTGRARFSIWADPTHVTEANLSRGSAKAGEIIDDLSLLVTFQCSATTPMLPTWDVGRQPSGPGAKDPITEASVIGRYREIVDRAHAHGIQVLAGFGLVDRGVDRIVRFDQWLVELTQHPDGGKTEATRFADALVDFMDARVPGFDGISFDIESCGLMKGSPLAKLQADPKSSSQDIEKLRTALRHFYHRVGERMAATSRVCAITVGGMMSDDAALLPLPSVPHPKANAMLAARLHTYDLAIGQPNIVLRPMAYDNAGGVGAAAKVPQMNRDPGQFEWHAAIVDFALGTKRLHPHQLQLGIKDFQPKDPAGHPTGQGGVVDAQGRILKRCREILRPNRVGLALFALFSEPNTAKNSLGEPWDANARYNLALNATPAGTAIPRPSRGHPMQVPLDARALAMLGK